MEGDKGGRIVCVTGGTGCVASWLVMKLLQRGYSVRATVRSKSDPGNKDLDNFYMVHTDDVAGAHLFLLENPDARGRYICSSTQVKISVLVEFLSSKYPEFQIPRMDHVKEVQDSRKSVQEALGFKFQVPFWSRGHG